MPGRFLTDLADVLRAAGLTVVEVPGWQTRARRDGAGGYANGTPTHVMIHHTASPASSDGQRDVDYIISGSPDRPISNLYTDRQGRVWVCAAGATNTNGKGVDTWGGGVPPDRMNEYAISNEIANTGVGEPYPMVQQQSVLVSTAALCGAYGVTPHRVRGHFEWAPTRKIDPAGPSKWAPSGGKWAMDLFRRDVADRLYPPTPPAPIPSEDIDMIALDAIYLEPDTVLTWDGLFLAWVENGNADAVLRNAKVHRETVNREQVKGVILASRTTTPPPYTLDPNDPRSNGGDPELFNLWKTRAL